MGRDVTLVKQFPTSNHRFDVGESANYDGPRGRAKLLKGLTTTTTTSARKWPAAAA